MSQDRREFLKGTAWMGLAAMAAGCMGRGLKAPAFAPEFFDPSKITLPTVSDAGEQQTV